jgi:spore maturation protein CgeB
VPNRDGAEELVVAGILDEFSYNIFKPECNLIYLNPLNYKSIILSQKIHLLFVESIWEGIDKKWSNPQNCNNESKLSIIKQIVKYCKNKNIPTVFWSKEDPVYFDYFKDISKLFDYVFTTDENCIGAYKKFLHHNRVYVLPFAAQPVIHNPVERNAERLGQIAFAGSGNTYNHKDRKLDMEIILKPALKYDISIYDRNYQRDNTSMRFPLDYQPYIKGGLPYDKILDVYKKYDIFLNINSVQNSPTMFSRRVFELLACGTNVISGYAVGIEKLFAEVASLCKTADETENFIRKLLNDSSLRDRLSLKGQREVFKHHTCKHRLAYILQLIGVKYIQEDLSGVTIITWVDKAEDLERNWSNFSRQIYNKKEIILIQRNSEMRIEKIANNINARILLANPYDTFEECVNKAIDSATYKNISFFNPSGYYGVDFVGDLMNGFLYAKADVIGKHTYYTFAKDSKKLYITHGRNEYKFSSYINPYAMIMNKSALDKVKFIYRNNDAFISEMQVETDVKMYSSDRFNYVFETESISELDNEILEIGTFQDYEAVVTV